MLRNRYPSRGAAGLGGAPSALRIAGPRVTGPWTAAGVAPGGGPGAGRAGRGGAGARQCASCRSEDGAQARPPPPKAANCARGLASQPIGGHAGDFLKHLFKVTVKVSTKTLKYQLVLVLTSRC